MNRDFILQWIDLSGEQLAELEYALSVVENNPRARTLCDAELARMDSEGIIEKIAADMDELSGLFGGKPHLFALAVLMHRLPKLIAMYAEKNIDPARLRAVLRDIPRWMKVCKAVYGYWGIAEYPWLVRSFRFQLFEIGALQFIRNTLPMNGITDCPGMPVSEVHIPEGADLAPESVTASMQAAYRFFDEHFGVKVQRFVCESWLLDPALSKILPDSRVAAFSRRFTITATLDSDQTVERVFGFDVKDYRTCERRTRLQRAVGEWLDAGNKCVEGIGYIDVDENGGISMTSESLNIFLDTDIGPDCDDTAALSILLEMHKQGKANLLGVTHCTGSPYGLPTIDAFCRLYGVEVPQGTCADKSFLSSEEWLKYTPGVAKTFPHGYPEGTGQPDAVDALVKALSGMPDNSVVFVAIGPLNNVARFLTDPASAPLMHSKVKKMVLMAGDFEGEPGHVEWNVEMDVPAMRTVAKEWKGVLELYPFEPFLPVMTGRPMADCVENPLSLSYKLYLKGEVLRPSWDPATVAGTILGLDSNLEWSPWGDLTVDEKGCTTLAANPAGKCRYVRLTGKADGVAAWLDGLIAQSIATMTKALEA